MNVIYEKRNSCENCKNFQQYYLKSYSRLVRAHCGRCLLRRASTNVAYVLPSHAACSAWENAEEQERLYNEKLMASLQNAINRLTDIMFILKDRLRPQNAATAKIDFRDKCPFERLPEKL